MIRARFTTDAPLLREALHRTSDVSVELDAAFVTTAGALRLLFWATCGDRDAFEAALDEDPTVSNVAPLVDEEEYRLYRADNGASGFVRSAYDELVAVDATFVSAVGTKRGWVVEVHIPERRALRDLWEWFAERKIGFRVESVGSVRRAETPLTYDLTPAQREALVLAYQRGYFDIPRGVALADLASELGISEQAFSERLRRGCSRVVGNAVEGESR
ncbi:helix-turn-helix domain-containing protein [Halegenticoccus tardaugens]|uniref:helix-turn-helix domain-containing protein n=1 Tax=Halegenticoccus tardaugens TaxID=2071624 RepID=UPI00100BC8FE|nr:helix-turn-helix domain-containing protein [Halegenticoccus tardaugens]